MSLHAFVATFICGNPSFFSISSKTFCRASIAHYKVPRYVRFVDEFPMTVTGKAQKFLMRKAMMEDLALVSFDFLYRVFHSYWP